MESIDGEQRKRVMPDDIHPLKGARIAKGLSLVKNAKDLSLGTTGSYQIQRWEKGENIPRLIFAEKIAQVLDFESAEEVQRLCREWQKRNVVKKCSQCDSEAEIECNIGNCAHSTQFCGKCYIEKHIPDEEER